MLHRLQQEHKHIDVLLRVLEEKADALGKGENVNFKLVRDVLEYMQGYAENSHHPLEDVIYNYYLSKYQDTHGTSRLMQEHDALVKVSDDLVNTVNLILSDVVVAKEKLITQILDYVKVQREHISYEERDIFPLLKRLMPHDWDNIVRICREQPDYDPMLSRIDNIPYAIKVAAGSVKPCDKNDVSQNETLEQTV